MPPRQINQGSFREFTFVVAQVGETVVAVGRNEKGVEVARTSGISAEETERELKQSLLSLSNSYLGLEEAVRLFTKVYPGGFDDPYYLLRERAYKVKSSQAFATAAPADLLGDISQATAVADRLRSVFGATDILHTVEKAKFRDALTRQPTALVRALSDVLAEGQPSEAFDAYAGLLRAEDACSWPNATYLLFLADPARWLFIKPSVLQACADRLGWEMHYDSFVSADTYRGFLDFGRELWSKLEPLHPRDWIDVHTFIFAVNHDGYVAEMLADRETWEATQ